VGLKTHCKLALVIRDEPDGLRRYAHIGTGNYNPKTARLYEDLGLLTSNREVTHDLTELFNSLSGFAMTSDYDSLLVAPRELRSGLIERIDHQIERKRQGQPARIAFKLNSLVDEAIIDKLYDASTAGVEVDLVIRGICALRPGVPGLSENIRVRSVLGRFLEHSRIFAFGCGEDSEVWIGSSDLMHRNLDRRVEVLVRLPSREHADQLLDLLDLMTSDETLSWHLGPDGAWTRVDGGNVQEVLITRSRSRRARG